MWFENMPVIKIYFTGFMTNYTNYTRVGPSCLHWTGLANWTGGVDWWTDTKNFFFCFWSYVETL